MVLNCNEELEKYKHKIKDIKDNVRDFNVYFSAQVKELLFLNEARSVNLEKKLIEYQNDGSNSLPFTQFLRILSEENGILIQQFWEFIKKSSKWDKKDIYEDTTVINEKIKKILKSGSVKLHYKYDTLKEFFSCSLSEEPSENIPFINYLWLKNFFLIENNEEDRNPQKSNTPSAVQKNNNKDKLTLSQKTDSIIERLNNIVFDNDKNVGAFFIVEYNPESNDPYFLAFNKGKSNGTIDNFRDSKFICDFIKGKHDNTGQVDSKKTIIEFHRVADTKNGYKWLDLYSNKKDTFEEGIKQDFISDNFNRLLLVRINKKLYKDKKEKIVETSKGVIGFYFKKDDPKDYLKITNINSTRYLLLLREELSSFIHKHHENNEFWEWREANIRNKLSLLTGHGRGMMLAIASNYPEYRAIVDTMLHVQQFVLNYADEELINKKAMPDEFVTLDLFKKYYASNKSKPYYEISLISEIFHMAKDIFTKFKDVENVVKPVDIYTNTGLINQIDEIRDNDIKIIHYGEVIKLIFFEVLINAKKNRWHFNVQDVPNFSNNVIEIKHSVKDSILNVNISNTGPTVPKSIIVDLNDSAIKNIKEDGDDVAGLSLIKTILKTFKLGSIKFSSAELDSNIGFGKFITSITFNSRQLVNNKPK